TDLTPPANNLVLNAMYMQFRVHNTTGSAILNPIAHLIIPSNTAGISPSGENTDISGNAIHTLRNMSGYPCSTPPAPGPGTPTPTPTPSDVPACDPAFGDAITSFADTAKTDVFFFVKMTTNVAALNLNLGVEITGDGGFDQTVTGNGSIGSPTVF